MDAEIHAFFLQPALRSLTCPINTYANGKEPINLEIKNAITLSSDGEKKTSAPNTHISLLVL